MSNKTRLEALIEGLLQDYLEGNHAARILQRGLDEVGIGFNPVLDHITLRTNDIDARAQEFVDLGYTYIETLQYGDWWAKVYRTPGFPALFVDQAYSDARGQTSVIPKWVGKFGDRRFHHVAVLVKDIDIAIGQLQARGAQFRGSVVGDPGDELRQIFSIPEQIDGEPFSVLELTERHAGYQGFSPPKADALMQSTVTAG
ncbi:MAG: VOC family protein [Nitrospirae bacterium]|nr:VOC family protein [Nitrospirota bacterium]